MSMIKVRAIAQGFYKSLRREDEVFHVREEHKNASWYVPLEDLKKAAPAPNRVVERPTTEAEAKRLTNDELKGFLDEEGIEYADGDVKADLIIKLFAANEGGEDEGSDLV